jgi:CRP-like cAMP-binding protein
MAGPDFLEMLHAYPEVTIRVLERLTRIVRTLDTRVARLSSQTEHQRIWTELLRLAKPDSESTDSWLIPDLPNHREIAAWSGTTKERVAAAIGELARDGIVKRKTMGLVISDMARLQTMTKNF